MSLLTNDEAVELMFKSLLGFQESKVGKYYFEEAMLDDRVWTDKILIPNTAPSSLTDGETSGVVKRHIDLELTAFPGSSNAYYNEALVNAINFKYGDGSSYDWQLKYNDGTAIQKGEYRWLKAPKSKVLYFYGGAPTSNMPPKISFYEYVGSFDVFSVVGQATELRGTVISNSSENFVVGNVDTDKVVFIKYSAERGGNEMETGYLSLTNYDDTKISWKSELDDLELLITKNIHNSNIRINVADTKNAGDIKIILTITKQLIGS